MKDNNVTPASSETHKTGTDQEADTDGDVSRDSSTPESGNRIIEPADFSRADSRVSSGGRRIRPLSIIVPGLFLLLFLVAWFMFSARAVQFNISPPPDSLAVTGIFPSWQVGDRYLMVTGSYRLLAKKTGYHDLSEPIEINSDEDQTFTLSMTLLPGSLSVITTPATAAFVLLDEKEQGTAPLTIDPIEAGTHQIQIISERFQTLETTVDIQGAGVAQSLEIQLVPAWATIQFVSEPAGATIRVDHIAVGSTPASVDILQGNRTLEISAPGYKTWSGKLVVEAGVDQQLPSIALLKADGTIKVTSQPADASVTVSGVFKGNTPLTFKLPPGKNYQLLVSKAGFESHQQPLDVMADKDLAIDIPLTPILGIVHLQVTPGDAELFIDGKSYGKANQSLQLTAQQHLVEILKPGYQTFSTRLTPRAGFEQRLEATLMTTAAAKAAAIPQIIMTSSGQQLKLIKPGSLHMGAPRREPGRRSNEIEKTVELSKPFYFGLYEVTNQQFSAFNSSHDSGSIGRVLLNDPSRPVVNITWDQAVAYCNWLSEKEGLAPAYSLTSGQWQPVIPTTTGYRLPTEAEWAFVARYASGDEPSRFPWGDAMPPSPDSGNYADESAKNLVRYYVEGYNDNFRGPAPGGSFPANAMGIYDLNGNVAEWVQDYYSAMPVSDKEVLKDPLGPGTGTAHVIRGASFMHGRFSELRWTYRDFGAEGRNDTGFRIARYLEADGSTPDQAGD